MTLISNGKDVIHLVIFSSGDFDLIRSAKRLEREAKKSRVFASISILNTKYLLGFKDFWIPFCDFLNSGATKGYGHWAWKPLIVRNFLDKIPQGEILLYLDAGCVLNLKGEESLTRFKNYITIVKKNGSLAFQLVNGMYGPNHKIELTERNLGDPELSLYLGCENFSDCNQIEANVIFLRKSENSKKFADTWYEVCSTDNFYWIDSLRRKNLIHRQYFQFDQAVFSLLWKKNNFHSLPQETYFADHSFDEKGSGYPIWAMRHKFGYHPYIRGARNRWEYFLSKGFSFYKLMEKSFRRDSIAVFLFKTFKYALLLLSGKIR